MKLRIFLFFYILFITSASSIGNSVKDQQQMIDSYYAYVKCHDVTELYINETYRFLDDIGFMESSNNHRAVNRFGYMGTYQFSMTLLRNLGYEGTAYTFLDNPLIQDYMMMKLLRHNSRVLVRQIEAYDGTMIDSRIITKSGILASAHLIGPYRTRLYLEYGLDFSDANGTRASYYLFRFSGYHIKI